MQSIMRQTVVKQRFTETEEDDGKDGINKWSGNRLGCLCNEVNTRSRRRGKRRMRRRRGKVGEEGER